MTIALTYTTQTPALLAAAPPAEYPEYFLEVQDEHTKSSPTPQGVTEASAHMSGEAVTTAGSLEFSDSDDYCTEDEKALKVTGVVRGAGLSANRLVHIPNYGDFQISKVRLYHILSRKKGSLI